MKKLFKILATSLLVLMTCFMFACMPSSVAKAQEKMEKAGYTVEAATNEADKADDCVGGFIATKSEGGLLGALKAETMIGLLFQTEDDAKDYLDDAKGLYEFIYGTVKQDGKWVYAGTSAAIEAFEK